MLKTGAIDKITADDREDYRALLTAKRQELLNLYNHDVKVGQESNDDSADDFADRANNSYNRELMFSLSDTERTTLLQVEAAVERLNSDAFGICTHCGDAIGRPRLKAVPWARYCFDCQEREELGLLRT